MNLLSASKRYLLTLAFALFVLLSHQRASGQSSIFQQLARYDVGIGINDPVVGDFNNDHQPDVAFISPAPKQIVVILRQGDGSYAPPVQTPISCGPTGNTNLVAADMDKDGNLDLVSSCSDSGVISVYRGNGAGGFATPSTTVFDNPGALSSPTDLNNDGYPDIVAVDRTTTAPGIAVLLNRGSAMPGSLANPVTTATPNQIPDSIATGDFNGDGKQDVVATGTQLLTLYGNGDGTLRSPQQTPGTGTLAVADLNNDGISDVALLNALLAEPASLQILLGDSSGQFVSKTPLSLPARATVNPASVIAGRFRTGGVVDLAAITDGAQILLNDGSGNLTLGTNYAIADTAATQPAADGKVDLIFFGSSDLELLVSNGDGTFRGPSALRNANGFSASDLNGDGIADLIFMDSTKLNTALGRGNGTFSTPQRAAPTSTSTSNLSSFAIGDFNQDGKADLVSLSEGNYAGHGNPTQHNAQLTFYPGDGSGSFPTAASPQDLQVIGATKTITGDFNGDSKLDLVYSVVDSTGLASSIYFLAGKGDGTFVSPVSIATFNIGSPLPLLAADFNNDHKLDFIAPGRVYLGNGDGTFQALPTNLSSFPLAVADLNGDNTVDLLVGPGLYRGNGDGTFEASPFFTLPVSNYNTSTSSTWAATVGDVNGDNNPDIVIGGSNGSYSDAYVFLGDGAGTFSLENTYFISRDVDVLNLKALARLNRNAPGVSENGRNDLLIQTGSGVASFLNQLNPPAPAQTSVQISVPSTSLNLGQTMNVSVKVTGQSPTGTVKVVTGTTVLGSATLSNGQASIPVSFSTAGSLSFTAQYAGDGQNLASSSTPVTVTVIAPDYSLSANPPSMTIKAGQTATFTISMATVGGYNGSVKLACSGLGSETTCNFSPATLTAGTTTSTLTITTTAPKLAQFVPQPSSRRSSIAWAALVGFLLLPAGVLRSRHRLLRSSVLFSLALFAVLQLAACSSSSSSGTSGNNSGGSNPGSGANPGTPAGTQTISVSASDASGGPSHSLNINLTVQ